MPVVSTCLQCIDNFYLMLFSQSLDAVMEERVDVVLDPLHFLPINTLQFGLQVLQVDLEQTGTAELHPETKHSII